jgi:hypothetical protein
LWRKTWRRPGGVVIPGSDAMVCPDDLRVGGLNGASYAVGR